MSQRTLLFSGHMIDTPDQSPARFSAAMVEPAQGLIEQSLAKLSASQDDLAVTQGACGGDLLFTMACHAHGIPVQWMQPFPEREFTERSVEPGGYEWVGHYVRAKQWLDLPIMTMEPPEADENPYAKCNRWMLDHAHSLGHPMHLICLWDGGKGKPGSTAHFVDLARAVGARIDWIDIRPLLDAHRA